MTIEVASRPGDRREAAGPAPLSLVKWLMGVPIVQAIHVAVKTGLIDALTSGPLAVEQLSTAIGANPDALRRLLRMLASIGVVARVDGARVALTPMGRYLHADTPGSVRDLAILGGEAWHLQPWANLLESVMTGEPAFNRLFGTGFFDYISARPECASIFNRAMDAVVGRFAGAVAAAVDLQNAGVVVDVGGGEGTLLAEILSRSPSARGVLFELDAVVGSGAERLRSRCVAERCSIVAGDFFEAVPHGADVYLLSHVLHDWPDEAAVKILRNCRRAMGERGRLVVVEVVVGESTDLYGCWLDLEMLVNFGGRERSEAEYRALFEQADLRLAGVQPTGTPVSILEAVPATAVKHA